jgi:hypothetical protein
MGFCVGTWGNDNQMSIFTVDKHVLRKTILKSDEAPLTSLSVFLPDKKDVVRWAVHSIFKVWEWYSPEAAEFELIFGDETGQMPTHSSKEERLNAKLIWSSPILAENL